MLNKILTIPLTLLLLSFAASISSQAVSAAGFDQQLDIEGQALYLNGEGPRKKAFMTVYDTALYLTEKGSDAKAIINADHPMSVNLVVRSRFATESRISDAFREGLEKSSGGNAASIEAQTEAFLAVFNQGVIKEDAFDFMYVPNVGVRVYKNDTLMATIEGLMFKQALFGIWLSANPVSDKLKSQLLGQ